MILDQVLEGHVVSRIRDDNRGLDEGAVCELDSGDLGLALGDYLINYCIGSDLHTSLQCQLFQILGDCSHATFDIVPHIFAIDLSHDMMHQYVG